MMLKKMSAILLQLSVTALLADSSSVKDSKNQLEWQDSSERYINIWKMANSYCKQLDLAGQSDWRLPTKEELLLFSKEKKYIKSFQYMSDNVYWSADDDPEDYLNAVTVYSGNGFISTSDKCEDFAVICVRGL